MRRACACLLLAAWFVIAASPTPRTSAQEGSAAGALKTTDFSGVYKHFQHAQDLEQKIALGEQALSLEKRLTSWPLTESREQIKGEIWFNLGSAYVSRASGVRADNLEKGVAYLEAALQVFTREASPLNWAAANNNLANAYQARIPRARR